MLEIYMADIRSLEQEELFIELLEQVSSLRREKVLACKNKKDRCRALAAGFLLRNALQAHGINEKEITYEKNPHGKLLLPEKLGLSFNLSHGGDYAVCALSDENVGIDLESMTERFSGEKGEKRFSSLFKKTLTEGEKALFEGLNWEAKIQLFNRIWTKKESFAKEDGRGMLIPFSEIDTLRAVYCADLEIRPGYWLSVYQKKVEEPKYVWVDLSDLEAVQ